MPHILLETTANIAENAHVPDILEELIELLCSFETIDPKSVKAYHTLRSVWSMGTGAPHGFAHCCVGVLSGRPIELRTRMSDAFFAKLNELLAESIQQGEAGVTFELREMDRDTYRKS